MLFCKAPYNFSELFAATRYKNLNSKIGTAQDDDNLIVQLRELNHSTNDLITSTNTQLKNLTESLKHLPKKLKVRKKLKDR